MGGWDHILTLFSLSLHFALFVLWAEVRGRLGPHPDSFLSLSHCTLLYVYSGLRSVGGWDHLVALPYKWSVLIFFLAGCCTFNFHEHDTNFVVWGTARFNYQLCYFKWVNFSCIGYYTSANLLVVSLFEGPVGLQPDCWTMLALKFGNFFFKYQ